MEEAKPELDQSLSQLPLEERYAMPPLIHEYATLNHAQLTASWEIGANGLHVTRHVERESPPEYEALLSNPNMKAKPVKLPPKAMNATHNNALKTVLFKLGELGHNVTKPVEEEYLYDDEKS